MRVAITTLGCRLNQFDSDAIERLLQSAGYQIVEDIQQADLHVINSCTITHAADSDTRKRVGRSVRDNPDAPVVVTGCYANADAQAIANIPGVALVLGNGEKGQLLEHLATLDAHQPAIAVEPFAKRTLFDGTLHPKTDPRRSRAYLKIQDGCNYRCAFCIVPQVRGNSRSLEPDQVIEQLAALVHAGTPEVVLTGVHLGTYGRDLSPKRSFSQLVEMMLPHLGQAKLRLGSLDPHEVDERLIGLLQEHPDKICRHLHLPSQSLDAQVLQQMRRAHSAQDFISLTTRLAHSVPGISIGSDIIVGHPGEDREAFEKTYWQLSELPIAYLHVFSYSIRQGTAAASMDGHVPAEEKKERSRRLRQLSDTKQHAFIQQFVGHVLPAVVLRRESQRTGKLVGLSDNYIKIHIEGQQPPRGSWTQLVVQSAMGGTAIGNVAEPLAPAATHDHDLAF